MKINAKPAFRWLLPGDTAYRKIVLVLFVAVCLKFLFFNFLWCRATTFTSFSTFEMWSYTCLAGLILVLPYVYSRSSILMGVILLALDLWFVSNLLYFRTYNTIIPFHSYGLAGNLSDFKESVYDSFRPQDIVFFIITVAALVFTSVVKRRSRQAAVKCKVSFASRSRFVIVPLSVFLVLFSLLRIQGGFTKAYGSWLGNNKFSCVVPMYTIAGSLYYEVQKSKEVYTPEIGEEIEAWLARHDTSGAYIEAEGGKDLILIFAESFESWVIGLMFEGKEITPNLNRVMEREGVFYAPHIQSQVKGGRSIDGQLLVNTGLLPIENGTYSSQYPFSEYPSLVKALREKHGQCEASVYTVDDPMVWNQILVAKAFGYDDLFDRSYFVDSEKIGPRKKTGDVPFLDKCGDMIINERKSGVLKVSQLVTYSGHAPFKLPQELALITFDGDIPVMMRDYMTMANYTDKAIGQFLDKLQAEGVLENTVVVITGDHEGLADNREPLSRSGAGSGVVSPEQFVPLIVINSPISGRYEPVMGQIDIYPTLLDLLGLDGYWWRGLGRSVFDPDKPPVAVTSGMNVVGDAEKVPQEMIGYMKKAWEISDKIICFDYFGIKGKDK